MAGFVSGIIFLGLLTLGIYFQIMVVLLVTSLCGGLGITKRLHKQNTNYDHENSKKKEASSEFGVLGNSPTSVTTGYSRKCQDKEDDTSNKECETYYSDYLLGILLKPLILLSHTRIISALKKPNNTKRGEPKRIPPLTFCGQHKPAKLFQKSGDIHELSYFAVRWIHR